LKHQGTVDKVMGLMLAVQGLILAMKRLILTVKGPMVAINALIQTSACHAEFPPTLYLNSTNLPLSHPIASIVNSKLVPAIPDLLSSCVLVCPSFPWPTYASSAGRTAFTPKSDMPI
jgi:hypothetical protein